MHSQILPNNDRKKCMETFQENYFIDIIRGWLSVTTVYVVTGTMSEHGQKEIYAEKGKQFSWINDSEIIRI